MYPCSKYVLRPFSKLLDKSVIFITIHLYFLGNPSTKHFPVAVAVTFFICWAPFHAQRLMAVYGSMSGIDSDLFNRIFHILDLTSGVLYFLSTCIDPLLYNLMSHKFREAFKVKYNNMNIEYLLYK